MDQEGVLDGFSRIPTIGWITFLFLGILVVMLAAAIIGVIFYVVKNRNFKTKYFECNTPPETRELFMA